MLVSSRDAADALPGLVIAFVADEQRGAELLVEVKRHVARVARPYPDAWFALGRKEPLAVEDLANRVFTCCARVVKGRHPFQGRTPFLAYARERFDGRTIRYHSFYARLSITRELMHQDYARNVVRDPVLRWQADLHRDIRGVLAEIGVAEGAGRVRRWSLATPPGLRSLVAPDALPETLRGLDTTDLRVLVREALARAGPLTHVALTRAITAALDAPPSEAPAPESPMLDLADRATVRVAVVSAWTQLSAEERTLLSMVVRGASFAEITSREPRFKDPSTLTLAIRRCNDILLREVDARASASSELTPRALLDRVFEVLLSCLPELDLSISREAS